MAGLRSLLITLTIGFSGAAAATLADLPAAPLVGASIAVSIAAVCRLKIEIPNKLRNFAFSIIGCSLGSGINREALVNLVHWPISLLLLGITVVVIISAGSFFLFRFFSFSPETSVLSTAPGAVSYTLALASSGIGDIRTIMVMQNVRLVLVATLLPFIIQQSGFAPGNSHAPLSSGVAAHLAVIFLALAIGILVERWHIPASFLLAGMIVSGLAHYLELVSGRPPSALIFLGFTITGSMVGVRFSSVTGGNMRHLLLASLGNTLIAGVLSASLAYPTALLLGIPFGLVFVSFTPGGIEAMAAMAIALGYDPAFVATHHLFRILLLFLIVPLSIKVMRRLVREGRAGQSTG